MYATTRAERLVAAINAMPIEDVRARIESARSMTAEEIVARQIRERRERAELARQALAEGDWQLPPADDSHVGEELE